jgi:hypothetical protein
MGSCADGSTTGACLEYLLRNDILAQLEQLCEADRPKGIKGELRSMDACSDAQDRSCVQSTS